jgi:hypothetical protein
MATSNPVWKEYRAAGRMIIKGKSQPAIYTLRNKPDGLRGVEVSLWAQWDGRYGCQVGTDWVKLRGSLQNAQKKCYARALRSKWNR